MKISSVKEVKDSLSRFLKTAEKEDIVITKNGKPTDPTLARGSFHSVKSLKAVRTVTLFTALLLAGCTSLKQCAYEGFNRDEGQKPAEVIRALKILPAAHIADLGSGSGYFTFRLARAVGTEGKVYAVDVDQGLNDYVAQRAQAEGYPHIEVILAKLDDPSLPESSVDMIFLCNTYHHLENRAAFFARAAKFLRSGGRIAIIDYNGKGWFESLGGHYTSTAVIKKEMTAAGYRLEREFNFLSRQYFLTFSKGKA